MAECRGGVYGQRRARRVVEQNLHFDQQYLDKTVHAESGLGSSDIYCRSYTTLSDGRTSLSDELSQLLEFVAVDSAVRAGNNDPFSVLFRLEYGPPEP